VSGAAEVAGAVFLAVGGMLTVVAAVGVVRLPDALLRMNAVTKASSLGVVSILAGVLLLDGSVRAVLTLTATAAVLLATAPVAGHVVGHAVYRSGAPLWSGTRREEGVSPGDTTDDDPSEPPG
jgi:multicomponent Na+:H+ antiporter subunit G